MGGNNEVDHAANCSNSVQSLSVCLVGRQSRTWPATRASTISICATLWTRPWPWTSASGSMLD